MIRIGSRSACTERQAGIPPMHMGISRKWAGISRRAVSVVLAIVMSAMLVPGAAWATEDAGGDASQTPSVTPELTSVSEATPTPSETSTTSDVASTVETDESDISTGTSSATVSEATTAITAQDDASTQVTVDCKVVGPDANGNDITWIPNTEITVAAGMTTAQMTKTLLEQNGYTCDDGDYAPSVLYAVSGGTLPNGVTSLGSVKNSDNSWSYWQYFLNGAASNDFASQYVLKSGDQVVWYYSSGSSLPSNVTTVDPDATRPNYSSSWPGYADGKSGGACVDTPTPTENVSVDWTGKLKDSNDWLTNVGDPIIVNGDLYIAVGDTLYIKDISTGQTKQQATLVTSINSTSHMVYSDGAVIVALAKGRLQALTADTLSTVWVTDELPTMNGNAQQSLSSLKVDGDYVYYGTAAADWSTSCGGYLLCVNIKTGAVRWCDANTKAGYYWDGAAVLGSYVVIADDSGALSSFDEASGTLVSSISIGSSSRASVIIDGDTAYAVSKDGKLHKVTVAANGALAEVASLQFASSSTTTPTLAGGKVIVGGCSLDGYANAWGGMSYYGALCVIDASTMTLETSISSLSDGTRLPGDVKSAPLVSMQASGTYVYFTCNSTPGGVYMYKLGDGNASALYAPEGDMSNYCMASVICDAAGNLYYTNDSGYLFKLVGSTVVPVPIPDTSSGGSDASGTTDMLVSDMAISDALTQSGSTSSGGVVVASYSSVAAASSPVSDTSTRREVYSYDDSGSTATDSAQQVADSASRPIWPWVLLGCGVLGLIGASGYLIASRKKHEAERRR